MFIYVSITYLSFHQEISVKCCLLPRELKFKCFSFYFSNKNYALKYAERKYVFENWCL